MNRILSYIFLAGVAILAITSCDKNTEVLDKEVTPPSYSKFNTWLAADTIGKYYIRSTNNTFKIPVGITTVAAQDRTIQLTYTSRTAVQGTQYNAPATIVIPAGKAVDSVTISGLFAGYTSTTRVDTVKIEITGGDVPVNAYKSRYYVIMRKYCDVVANNFLGAYTRTNELFGTSAYGPYTTGISSVTPISATKARIVVTNIWDFGWGPISFDLDWTDPANFIATPIAQNTGIADAGTISAAYAGQQVAVRPFSGSPGTFSSCDQTLTLRMQLGVNNGTTTSYFSSLYTVTMVR